MKFATSACALIALCGALMATASARAQHDGHPHGTPDRPSAAFSPDAALFLAENDAAMARMMAAMHVTPSGDIDRDFVTMMIPHHQGAIDMARAALRSSRNDAVRRLAQEIIVTQEDEIRAMRLAIGLHAMAVSAPAHGATGQAR